MMTKYAILLAAASLSTGVLAQQGVSADTLTIGSIQDLSGPIAGFGKQVRMGMLLAVDEVNEQGGVSGRKLDLKVEDSGYDPKRAVLAAQKLVNQDKIFAMVGHIGTAQNLAALPVQMAKNVVNFFPITAAREMFEPLHPLKYAFAATYYDQIRQSTIKLVKEKNLQKVCTMYQDDEFGLEIQRGAEEALKTLNLPLVEKTSYKRGATDFSSQVARLKAANCDLVVLGTIIRETVGSIAEARKTGFNPVFLGSSAAYGDLIPKLGGKVVEGLYTAMTAQHPYLDEAAQPIRFWATKYKTKFGEDPTVFSVYGYQAVTNFAAAAAKAGKNLTTESFIKVMDATSIPADIFGSPALTFSAKKRLGNEASRLSQIREGRWVVVSDYMK